MWFWNWFCLFSASTNIMCEHWSIFNRWQFLGLGYFISLSFIYILSLFSRSFTGLSCHSASPAITSNFLFINDIGQNDSPSLFQEESSLFRNTSDTLDQRSQHAFNLREDHTFIIGRTNIASYILYTLYKTEKAFVFLAP